MLRRGIALLLVAQILVVALYGGIPTYAQADLSFQYNNALEPENVIESYFNAIHLKDYSRAYNYWEYAPNGATYAQFVAGYNNTQSVEAFLRLPVRVGVALGNAYSEIPTIIVATHRDNSVRYFAGCYVVHATTAPVGNDPNPVPIWRIQEANVVEVADMDTAETHLNDLCAITPYN